MQQQLNRQDTIVAPATPSGSGAIGVIRLSGSDALNIVNKVFKGKDLLRQASHTVHFGTLRDENTIIDEVLVSLFIAPHSYTRENVVEISTHGSQYITERVIKLLISNGARPAQPGEFTLRAFMNGAMDLSQAEAVADLIASNSAASHQIAMQQMRGGFSSELKKLRESLIHFASLIELELDFAEEDVEFANRGELRRLIDTIHSSLEKLINSFEQGNVLKNGVPVVIAGKPNVGKSTLLNALLKEDRAIVSDVAGTTRDSIEDEITIEGIVFRFIDTAGLRETNDVIEAIGVERTKIKMKQARLIIYLFDPDQNASEIRSQLQEAESLSVPVIGVLNKSDLLSNSFRDDIAQLSLLPISARDQNGLDLLTATILKKVHLHELSADQVIVTNIRHVEALTNTKQALERVLEQLDTPTASDFLAMDIRQALYFLGEITGSVSTDDLLENIFTKFCIGK